MADPHTGGAIPDTEFIDANDPDPHPNPGHDRLTPPVNTNPAIFSIAFQYIQTYGWVILIGAIVLWYVGSKLKAWYDRQRDLSELGSSKKSDSVSRSQQHMEAQDRARRRMQQQHDEQAAKFKEHQAIREEKKRQEKVEDWERHQEGRGYRSKYHPPDKVEEGDNSSTQSIKKKNVLRNRDFNPLTGDSSSTRHDRRTFGPRGGG